MAPTVLSRRRAPGPAPKLLPVTSLTPNTQPMSKPVQDYEDSLCLRDFRHVSAPAAEAQLPAPESKWYGDARRPSRLLNPAEARALGKGALAVTIAVLLGGPTA